MERNRLSCLSGLALVLLFVLFPSLGLRAQQFNFRSMTQGFPEECYCVLQDSKGFVWVSSDKGLFRYDGSKVKRFGTHNGLPDASVFQLTEDSHGRILFGTAIGQVGYISNDSVVFPPFNSKLKQFLKYGSALIFDVYADKNKILWIATYSGLYRTLKPDDYSDVEQVNEPGLDSSRFGIKVIDGRKAIYSIYETKSKVFDRRMQFGMFVHRESGITTLKYYTDAGKGNPTHCATVALSNGNVLWAIYNRIYNIAPDGSYTEKFYNSEVCSLSKDRSGAIWVGLSKGGLLYYDNEALEGKPITSLQGCSISGVMQDAENGIWVTTLEKGVFYANSKSVVDYSYIAGLNNKSSGIGVVNNKVLINDDDNFLTEISDTGIARISPPTGLSLSSVNNYMVLGKDVYITAFPCLLRADTSFSNWKKMGFFKKTGSGSMQKDLALTANGTLFGVYYGGLDSLCGDSLIFIGVSPARAGSVCITGKGEILVGTTNGLYQYRKGNNYTEIDPNKRVISIKEDKRGDVWVASLSGLDIIRDDKVIVTITEKDGLASNALMSITFDQQGNGWAATDNGVSKIVWDGKTYTIRNFDTRNGLISNDVYSVSAIANWLWISTANGLCKMDIMHEPVNTAAPKVYVESVYVNDSLSVHQTEFSHTRNNFIFHLQGLTFKDNRTRFTYRLLGLDTNWHGSDFADVPYSNLSSGDYTFQAKAINADGVASVIPASFSFTIKKPYWKAWWFLVLEILSIAALIYTFIYFRLKTIRMKEAESTRINKMLAEYQMTALRAQMNPHFIFNAINSIQEYVLENDPQKAYNYLTKFAQLVRMVLNNAKEKYISLEKDLETLQIYVELEQLRFGNKFDFVLDVDKQIDSYNVQLPAMVIQPYVENAIWHGLMPLGNLRKGKLTVEIKQQGDGLSIVIEDNGIGRENAALVKKTKQHKSIGMELTRQRLDMLNSLPEYSSSTIIIKDMHDEAGMPSGTRVEIKIIAKPA